jgi:uncharacterized protein YndB with AHSA1/START domain
MSELQVIAEPGVPQIVIIREFAAPRALLFRAYTEAKLFARWIGPAQYEVTVNQLDPRHGGRWRYTHYDKAGKGYAFHGLFHGIPTVERIVQTYEFDQQPGHIFLNTITFSETAGRTTLRQNSVFQTLEDRDGYVSGGMELGIRRTMAQLDELVTQLAEEA